MSLFSIVDEAGLWWRTVFALTALLGVIEILLHWRSSRRRGTGGGRLLRGFGLLVYVLVLIVAAYPTLIAERLGVRALAVEAVLSGLLVVIGIHLAFQAITEPHPRHA
jgi:hypothetical protein